MKGNKDDEDVDEICVFGVLNGDDTCWLSVFGVADEVGVAWGLTRLKEKPPCFGGSLLGDENSSDPAFVVVVAGVVVAVVVVVPVVKGEVWGLAALAPNMNVVLVGAVLADVALAMLKVPRLKPEAVTFVATGEAVEGMDEDVDAADDRADEVFIPNWKPPTLGD